MNDPALSLYEQLVTYEAVEGLITDGEAEGLLLECKTAASPRLDANQKAKLGEALSGFSNTSGGIILYGVSTDKRLHSELDILTQLEPIGFCRQLAKLIENTIPTLTVPSVVGARVRPLCKKPTDRKGVVVVYVPPTDGDPVQVIKDSQFYFRSGDDFRVLPYEILRRMFAGSSAPHLVPSFRGKIRTGDNAATLDLSVTVSNTTTASAKDSVVVLSFTSESEFGVFCSSREFRDLSKLNEGKATFAVEYSKPIYRGFSIVFQDLHLTLKGKEPSATKVRISTDVHADGMRSLNYVDEVSIDGDKPTFTRVSESVA